MGSEKEKDIANAVDTRLEDLFGDANENAVIHEDEATASAVSKGIDALLGDDSPFASAESLSKDTEQKSKEKKPKPKKKHVPPPAQETDPQKLLLNDLKEVIFSLEWEITDQVMQTLEDEIRRLEEKCKDEKITIAFLQLLNSLGKYIRKKKADAHPDSMGLIRSVFDGLEKVMLSPQMSESVKKKMLISEVNKYKELKTQIALKTEVGKKQAIQDAEAASQEETAEQKSQGEEQAASSEIIIPPFSLADQGEPLPSSDNYSRQAQKEPFYEGYRGDSTLNDVVRELEEIKETIKAEFEALREEIRVLGEKR